MELYPEIEPYNTGYLKVSDLHEIYYEEVGSPDGAPVLFLHGGPGGGLNPNYRRFFDPKRYRVVLFDQRGAGKSKPHAELTENTTWHLLKDIEILRNQLGISQWIVFGGSWGSTLALIYAINHSSRVTSLCLRGIFMCRPHEIQWFYQQGASRLFPDSWEHYLAPIPEEERNDLVKAYYKRLTSEDYETRLKAARAWSTWEGSTSQLIQDRSKMESFGNPDFALAFARIECHYFIHNIFTDSPSYILDHTDEIQHIPTDIVHGRYDVICPLENAWELHKKLPQSKLHIIEDAGHSAMEEGIRKKLLEIMDKKKG